jgi:serine/threonine-protein kinase
MAGEANPNLAPGAILAGKYRVERLLGQGGMGMVVLAHHEELDHRVAIKVLIGEMAENPEIVARFMREARAAAKLQSDHVVRVTDVGRLDGVGPYMVMEYLKGLDLGQLLEKRGPLPTSEAVDFILEAIDALAEAHAIGIIHRDLKPSNLFLAERTDGTQIIKVLDFGISKVDPTHEPATSKQKLTSTRAVIGSPAYMSPEQLKSARDVDARADVWSIGVVLYELLAGALPFDGATVGALFANIVSEDPKPLRPLRADIPELLEGTILRCLQRDAKTRYGSVADLAQALAPFGSGRAAKEVQRAVSLIRRRQSEPAIEAASSHPAIAKTAPQQQQTQNNWQTPRNVTMNTRRTAAMFVIGGAVVAVAIAAIGIAILTHKRKPETTVATQPSSPVIVTTTASVATVASTPSPTTSPTPTPTPSTAPAASSVPVTTTAPPPTVKGTARPVRSAVPSASGSTPSFLDRQR